MGTTLLFPTLRSPVSMLIQYLFLQADVGTTLLFKGPKGRFRYERGTKKAIGA